MPPLRPKLTYLQCLRGLAALTVALSHFPHWSVPQPWHVTIYNCGYFAVFVFFGISGFIIAYSHRDETGPRAAGNYAVKRILRLFPAYLFFSALQLGIHVLGWDTWDHSLEQHRTVLETVAATTLLPLSPRSSLTFLSVGWSLMHEVVFYLLFATFYVNRRVGLTTIAAFSTLVLINGSLLYLPYFWLHPTSLLFMAGCALGLYRRPLPIARSMYWALGIAGLLTTIGILSGPPLVMRGNVALFAAATLVFSAVGLDQTAGDRSYGLIHRGLRGLGDISYSLYLCHTLVHALVFRAYGAPQDSVLAAVLFVTMPVAAAWVSYRLIEKPAQRLGRRGDVRRETPRVEAPVATGV